MKLYTVKVSDEFVVLAESAEEAKRLVENSGALLDVEWEVEYSDEMTYYPDRWSREHFPYCASANKETIGELVAVGFAPTLKAAQELIAKSADAFKNSMRTQEP